jgi:hypothetical protein
MLLLENPNDRPNLEDIENMLKGQTIKTPRKKSMDNSDKLSTSSLRKNKSNSSN